MAMDILDTRDAMDGMSVMRTIVVMGMIGEVMKVTIEGKTETDTRHVNPQSTLHQTVDSAVALSPLARIGIKDRAITTRVIDLPTDQTDLTPMTIEWTIEAHEMRRERDQDTGEYKETTSRLHFNKAVEPSQLGWDEMKALLTVRHVTLFTIA